MEASGKGPRGLLGALGAVKEVPGGLGRFWGPFGDLLRESQGVVEAFTGLLEGSLGPRELSKGSREGHGAGLGAQGAAEKMADH